MYSIRSIWITWFSNSFLNNKLIPSQQSWNQSMQPLQISYPNVCQMLDISRDTLRVLILRDPTFPMPIKYGDSRQAPVFFSYVDLVEWHNKRKMPS